MEPNPELELSIVVPVFDSRDCTAPLVARLVDELDRLGRRYEIVLVDDDSGDGGWPRVREEAERRPAVRAVRLMRNAGQVAATLCGLAESRGAVAVTIDGDLEQPPDQIPVLLAALDADPELDAVFGHFESKRHRGYRNLASRLVSRIVTRACGLPAAVRTSSFRALRRRLVDAVLAHPTRVPSLNALIGGASRRVASVAVRHDPRHAGRSAYTLGRQLRLAFDVFAATTTLPLRAVSALGLTLCAASFGYGLVVLGWYFAGRVGVPGWTTLALLVAFSAGAVLLALGVLGEYLARVLREVRGAPLYQVRERVRERTGGTP
jgi:dolichol-phosphate mannosyltransferase/undecaprenyl-phosphate 4-deoxy-4-formamido-L-arabinose transferase